MNLQWNASKRQCTAVKDNGGEVLCGGERIEGAWQLHDAGNC